MGDSIALSSKDCIAYFTQLSALLDKETLQQPPVSLPTCVDELGRFRIWANNIGALLDLELENSLDHRLREAPKLRLRIIDFLDDLRESLGDACAIVSKRKDNRRATIQARNTAYGTTELQEIFESVKDTITSLMKVSIIIRNATPRDRYARAETAIKKQFLDYFDVGHVGHKYPKVESQKWLKARLGNAITKRRCFLKYCRDHHQKFSATSDVKEHGVKSVANIGELILPKCDGPSSNLKTRTISVRSGPDSTIAPTAASTLHVSSLEVEGDISDSYSQSSYATSLGEDSADTTLRVPRLAEITTSFPFECPYCWTLLDIKHEARWRRHVYRDMRPYVCTFENCDMKLFADKHEWFDHELEIHRTEWCCRLCSHAPHTNAASFKAHTRQHAPHSTAEQLEILSRASKQQVGSIPASACPLCDWETLLRNINMDTRSDEVLVVTPKQFRHHLGHHMEQLALFALPRNIQPDDEDADSNKAASLAGSQSLSKVHSSAWGTEASRSSWDDSKPPDLTSPKSQPTLVPDRGAGGQPGDPAMAEVDHDFEDLVQTIMGVTPQQAGRDRGTRRPDSPLPLQQASSDPQSHEPGPRTPPPRDKPALLPSSELHPAVTEKELRPEDTVIALTGMTGVDRPSKAEQDPESMDATGTNEPRPAHTQEEFRRWKERMKAAAEGRDKIPERQEMIPQPEIKKPEPPPMPAFLEIADVESGAGMDKFFASYGEKKTSSEQKPAEVKAYRKSRFAALFSSQSEDDLKDASLTNSAEMTRTSMMPGPEAATAPIDANKADQEHFQRVLQILANRSSNNTPQSGPALKPSKHIANPERPQRAPEEQQSILVDVLDERNQAKAQGVLAKDQVSTGKRELLSPEPNEIQPHILREPTPNRDADLYYD
ncbi:hypothetical protein GJ744_008423 [Endocarpon pusillum]|uniref:Oxidoreductase acuF-like C2H2 type zinc-finger domain-containing protein n=1 Tax=Endocarpon pusillum TaxID=364733 RepID=A0A8H7AH54_9EURO|nr:hypothetical protein GJ744_008423 [Endocarpon pusillum]